MASQFGRDFINELGRRHLDKFAQKPILLPRQ
jgi:hypothetical protein